MILKLLVIISIMINILDFSIISQILGDLTSFSDYQSMKIFVILEVGNSWQ